MADTPETPPQGTPRRNFFSTAFISLSSVVTGALAGCASNDVAPNAAENAEFDALRSVDPKRVTYKPASQIPLAMETPRGIALDLNGVIAVVGDRILARYDSSGKQSAVLSLEGDPTCVAFSPDGATLLGMTDHVEIYAPNGARTAVWTKPSERSILTALFIHKDDIYVADAGGRVVLRCDPNGNVRARIGEKNEASGYPGLVIPSPHLDVAIASDGNVLISNPGKHQVETHTPDGKFLAAWGKADNTLEAFCGCCNPTDFVLLPDGRFMTCEKGIPRVKIYSAKGEFEAVVAPPDVFPSTTMGLDLVVGKDGKVYVLDAKAKRIRVFTPLGNRDGGKAA